MEENLQSTTKLSMVDTLKTVWVDIGDIVIFLAILVVLYAIMKYIVIWAYKRGYNIPILTVLFTTIITVFTKKVNKTYKDGKELETYTDELVTTIKEDLKKKEDKNEA